MAEWAAPGGTLGLRLKGGKKLEDRLIQIAKQVTKAHKLKVGFLEGATYPDGTYVAMVAAIQNYGAPRAGIPPRPFFSNVIADKSDGWGDALARNLQAADFNSEPALKLLGELIKGQVQQSIRDTNDPPLKPATVKRKGFAKPLIDTSHMINSVDYAVE